MHGRDYATGFLSSNDYLINVTTKLTVMISPLSKLSTFSLSG